MSADLFEAMMESDAGRNIMAEFDRIEMARVGGYSSSQQWLCEDGWIIEYTTSKVFGGPHDGKFVVMAYKPYGQGARGGRKTARNWQRTYIRGFVQRKSARARAEVLFYRHSPALATKHGKAS
jgi:hypothetical protein